MTAPRRCRYWRCRQSFIGKREGARFCSDLCRTRDYAEHHPRVHLKRQPAHKAGRRRSIGETRKIKAELRNLLDKWALNYPIGGGTVIDRIMEIFDR